MCGQITVSIPISVAAAVEVRVCLSNLLYDAFVQAVGNKVITVHFALCFDKAVYEALGVAGYDRFVILTGLCRGRESYLHFSV